VQLHHDFLAVWAFAFACLKVSDRIGPFDSHSRVRALLRKALALGDPQRAEAPAQAA
jgi:hypothetical protein